MIYLFYTYIHPYAIEISCYFVLQEDIATHQKAYIVENYFQQQFGPLKY